jgi:hypothetical protein
MTLMTSKPRIACIIGVLDGRAGGSVDIYQCLAANAITQHQFQSAKGYVAKQSL